MNKIIQGDALQILRQMPNSEFGGIITDPPYSSGGLHIGYRQKSTATKYTENKSNNIFPNFAGDAKDQRSWTNWTAEWLRECLRVSKQGAIICIFIDWRQLPSLTDALQWADWTWRGVLVWDKINCRPQKGRFKQQAEFIVWGSKGNLPTNRNAPCLNGIFNYSMAVSAKRVHQVEKPLKLMRELIKIVEPNEKILDPFCGSGTTLLAAQLENYQAVGIEVSEEYTEIARQRLNSNIEI
ncbi:MAG: site-specific DNA-methyltransferase [Defluviitaleaceae bacterium]|nr:site-specific DNA-methyltransferase [Defluviitaleaceae bacterium]